MELIRVDYTVVGLTNSNCLELITGNFPNDSQKVRLVLVCCFLLAYYREIERLSSK